MARKREIAYLAEESTVVPESAWIGWLPGVHATTGPHEAFGTSGGRTIRAVTHPPSAEISRTPRERRSAVGRGVKALGGVSGRVASLPATHEADSFVPPSGKALVIATGSAPLGVMV
jgi:hypothetical protein